MLFNITERLVSRYHEILFPPYRGPSMTFYFRTTMATVDFSTIMVPLSNRVMVRVYVRDRVSGSFGWVGSH